MFDLSSLLSVLKTPWVSDLLKKPLKKYPISILVIAIILYSFSNIGIPWIKNYLSEKQKISFNQNIQENNDKENLLRNIEELVDVYSKIFDFCTSHTPKNDMNYSKNSVDLANQLDAKLDSVVKQTRAVRNKAGISKNAFDVIKSFTNPIGKTDDAGLESNLCQVNLLLSPKEVREKMRAINKAMYP